MKFRDYYETLGVSKKVSEAEIKQAYRRLARKYHPDVNPGDKSAERHFKEVNEAHEVLSNKETRGHYDELGQNWRSYDQIHARKRQSRTTSPFSSFRDRRPNIDGSEVFNDRSFSDFFQNFFDGSSETRPGGIKSEPQVLEISLEQAFHGLTQKLVFQEGQRSRSVEIRIPSGVTDNSLIKVPSTVTNQIQQTIQLRIKITPHSTFKLRGKSLIREESVSLLTAVLGGTIETTGLDGSKFQLKIPPGTQNDQIFRLKGQGMPSNKKSSQSGNLLVAVKIKIPTRLGKKARSYYEALASIEKSSD